ncbi:hypothetical protein DSM43276_04378 [Mycobacteroides salmoniphilum]|nr:hypothetical protein DSM43276_04378 [Mycobacteroides salmoniphilum]
MYHLPKKTTLDQVLSPLIRKGHIHNPVGVPDVTQHAGWLMGMPRSPAQLSASEEFTGSEPGR